MHKCPLILFWVCVLGTVVRVPLLWYEFWLLATGVGFSELTVRALLTEHLPFLSWIADIIVAVLGAEFGSLILSLPATLMTMVKLVFGTLIGYWALDRLREIDSSYLPGCLMESGNGPLIDRPLCGLAQVQWTP